MHTYASVRDFQDFVRDNGAGDLGSALDGDILKVLEGASRKVEGFCNRSKKSGFGPRVGTNRYDGDGCNELYLHDDLLSLSAFTVAAVTGAAGVSPVVDTDYYLGGFGNYDPPYRKIVLHGVGTPTTFASGYRTIVATGTWGYQSTTVLTGTTVESGLDTGTTQTQFVLSASPDVAAGQTLLIGSEQLYLRDLDGTTATVERGSNGTTAATHADDSAISVYTYPSDVVTATLSIALRRRRLRDAGVDGSWGGGQMPGITPRDTEHSLLWSILRDFVIPNA